MNKNKPNLVYIFINKRSRIRVLESGMWPGIFECRALIND